MKTAAPSAPSAETVGSRPSGAAATDGPSFRTVLEGLAERVDQGENLVQQMSVSPAGGEAGRLIALQSGIYRYSEAIDLTAKLVVRASSAVKTCLQSQ